MIKEAGYDKLVNIYFQTKNFGHLPFSGGFLEQPMHVQDLLTICSNEDIRMQNERIRRGNG